ncbi:MAG: inositol monophosphatase [Alphaproteobacteria bacterium]|nr:inositol monophosphatase [Alphaproteobacteria bacterium]
MLTARLTGRSALLNVMISAAEKAGRALTRDFGEVEQLQVSRKGLGDFVSTADHRAEKIIIQELNKARPGYSFLLEETGSIEGTDPEHCWIVDPLDGTLNFLHGIPQFCVSLALKKKDEIIAGVIFNPILDELYCSEKGKGAFLNQRRLRVSGRRHLDEALITIGTPYRNQVDITAFNHTDRLIGKVAGMRRFGSAALDLAYVAAGKFEASYATHLQAWDMAAGILMVKESGGYVCDSQGGQNILDSGSVLASNDHLFEPLSKLLIR